MIYFQSDPDKKYKFILACQNRLTKFTHNEPLYRSYILITDANSQIKLF